jgi:hypothetical protein
MDSSLVARVGFDVVWMKIDGLSVNDFFILNCWSLSFRVAKLQQGMMIVR